MHGLRSALLAVLLGLMVGALSSEARAASDVLPVAGPAVLDQITAQDVSATETDLVLSFSPKALSAGVINATGTRLAVGFASTSRATTAALTGKLKGVVRGIEFEQHDSVLVMVVQTATSASLEVQPVGDQIILLKVRQATARPEEPTRDAAAAHHPARRDPGEDGFEAVFLKYADVSEVVGLLVDGVTIKSNDAFIPREPAFGSAGIGQAAGLGQSPSYSPDQLTQPLAQSVDDTISVDRRLNAIFLKGSRETIERLKEKIRVVDVPVDSVLLETLFVELDKSGASNVGLSYSNGNGQIGIVNYQTGAYVSSGSGVTHLTSAAFQAAIYAQVEKGRGRIVSKPRISALSGGTAKIITGDALPILTAITLSGVNGVSQQVQYVNVGVTLQIAPRVSDDGYVTSHLFCEVSSVTGASQGYPTISQREAETAATVRDGETFVIGGLTQRNELTSRTAVPGLGGLPVVGSVFGLNQTTTAATELYIVITPHIIHAHAPPAAVSPIPPELVPDRP